MNAGSGGRPGHSRRDRGRGHRFVPHRIPVHGFGRPAAADGPVDALLQGARSRRNALPVTFRTLDLGGDKVLPYLEAEREDNPALGWRAVRMGLDRPALLRMQLRALIAAAAGRPLQVMFPLVANVEEFRSARALVEREVAWAERRGRPAPAQTGGRRHDRGAVPALAPRCAVAAHRLRFGRHQRPDAVSCSPPIGGIPACRIATIRSRRRRCAPLKSIRDACVETGTPVSVCGEMAGRPLEAFALVALGFERLSMPPAGIGPVKQMVLSCDRGAARKGIEGFLRSAGGSLRGEIESLARKLFVAV